MTTYKEKLKNPRWQKKRLEILERDNWECQNCGETKKTLCVHHRTYFLNRDPWEYENKIFITLCEDCHSDPDEVAPWSTCFTPYLLIGVNSPNQVSKETILAFREAKKLGLCNTDFLDWLNKAAMHYLKREKHIKGIHSITYLKYLKDSSGKQI